MRRQGVGERRCELSGERELLGWPRRFEQLDALLAPAIGPRGEHGADGHELAGTGGRSLHADEKLAHLARCGTGGDLGAVSEPDPLHGDGSQRDHHRTEARGGSEHAAVQNLVYEPREASHQGEDAGRGIAGRLGWGFGR